LLNIEKTIRMLYELPRPEYRGQVLALLSDSDLLVDKDRESGSREPRKINPVYD
jgi:hypothetical protein